jgi:nucleoside-diphosphate-sugar epimerase
MTIIFSGASSFSGYWFARELARRGALVLCTFTRGDVDDYVGMRRERVSRLVEEENIVPFWECSVEDVAERLYDDSEFKDMKIDGFCSHAGETTDYKSPSFDIIAAAQKNTAGMETLFPYLRHCGARFALHTGTYFEVGEGKGVYAGHSFNAPVFSPYAASKTLTWEYFQSVASRNGIRAGKFVMPNPFGVFEERGFVRYLATSWAAGETPVVQAPDYVRDNMPVTLMAAAYFEAVQKMNAQTAPRRTHFTPSGFVGSQRDFAQFLAKEFSKRWKRECPLEFAEQTDYSESLICANSCNGIAGVAAAKDALKEFWKDLTAFYKK